MKQKKKNKFYTFILSFMPGAAEMYMGFMKKGVSLMGIFLLSMVIPVFLRLDILAFAAVLVWCYSFFHARNLAASEDVIFEELKDDYIWASFVNERNIILLKDISHSRVWGHMRNFPNLDTHDIQIFLAN